MSPFAPRLCLLAGAALLLGVTLTNPLPAYAATETTTNSQSRTNSLRALAAKLVDSVGSKLDDADAMLSGTEALQDRKTQEQLAAIPDGETLILQTRLLPRKATQVAAFTSPDPLIGIKQGDDIYIDFAEFVRLTGFGVTYDAEHGTAKGWTYREDQPFVLSLENSTVTIGDQTKKFAASDTILDGDILYVRSSLLSDWLNIDIKNIPQAQSTDVVSRDQLMPTQERIFRRDRRAREKKKEPPQNPRLAQPDKIFTMPTADVQIAQEIRRSGNNSSAQDINRTSYNVLATNETFGHEATAFVAGNNENPLDQVRLNLKKESEKNDLLGILQAKVYEVGDHTSIRVPHAGGTGLERGVRVSNRGDRFTVDTETIVDGNGQPGWDIELYRNGSFVDGKSIGEDGYYAFDKVQLFAGDNRMKLIFYGPQGEVREEERLITVAPNLVGSVKGYYDVSLSQKGEITYRADSSNKSPDIGTPRLSATYDRRVGENLTLRGGLHSVETRGQRDNYFYSGAATTVGQTVLNGDLVTTSDGPFATYLQARRRFGEHSASAGARYQSENFSETYVDEKFNPTLALYGVDAGLQGPWLPSIFADTRYDSSLGLTQNSAGTTYTSAGLGLSSRFMGMRFNNRLSTRQVTGAASSSDLSRSTYDGSVFGRYKTLQWQGGWSYELQPDPSPVDTNLRLSKRFSQNLSGSVETRHTFNTGISSLTASANYTTDKATFSPTLSYDTDSNMRAYLGVNFSLAQDPYSGDLAMTSRRLSTLGGISVMAFLDKEGDGVFNDGDEPLEDVVINLKQINRDLITGKDGNAFAYDLPTNKVTDVSMEESTAFEPSWVSGFDGVSFRPRPGDVTRLEFPVLRGAEMDGTASVADNQGKPQGISGITLRLETPDGIEAKGTVTPFDGFYVIEAIKPGVYYLTTDSADASINAYRVPEKIVVTPEGAQIYGHNIMLTRGYDIRFTFSAANANPALQRRTKILKPEDIAREDIYLRLGNYRSSLTATLAWYKFKLRTRGWSNPLTPVAQDFDTVTRDGKTGLLPIQLKPAKPLRMQEAAQLCERLVDAGFEGCGVDVVTTYNDGTDSATAAPAQPTKG